MACSECCSSVSRPIGLAKRPLRAAWPDETSKETSLNQETRRPSNRRNFLPFMHTIIPSHSPSPPATSESLPAYRQPHFECSDLPRALKLLVLVPGVEASGVEITTIGPDLVITASKAHVVRVNWQALHLEGVQHDYQLRLRLGHDFNFAELQADLREGVLTIIMPKLNSAVSRHTQHPRLVA